MELKQIAIEKDNNDDLKSFKSRFVNKNSIINDFSNEMKLCLFACKKSFHFPLTTWQKSQ